MGASLSLAGTGAIVKIILSLFDYSGEWSRPYRENGYEVIQVDIKHGHDIMTFDYHSLPPIHGILAAPPCTDFAVSGNRWWAQKDKDGHTADSIRLVARTLEIIDFLRPEWWVLENPVGRIGKFFPRLGKAFWFQPCDYGDAYTKRTGLYGDFVPPYPLFLGRHMAVTPDVPPREHFCGADYHAPLRKGHHSVDHYMIHTVGLKATGFHNRQAWRSVTPPGFARAFYQVNP